MAWLYKPMEGQQLIKWNKKVLFPLFRSKNKKLGVTEHEDKADWYDPFIEADDDMLADIDRTSLAK